jgi:hypothetical protein
LVSKFFFAVNRHPQALGEYMRVLVIYCQSVETSYNAARRSKILAELKILGHEIDDCDLFVENKFA